MRITPLKSRFLSFREIQAELRDMTKETKKVPVSPQVKAGSHPDSDCIRQ